MGTPAPRPASPRRTPEGQHPSSGRNLPWLAKGVARKATDRLCQETWPALKKPACKRCAQALAARLLGPAYPASVSATSRSLARRGAARLISLALALLVCLSRCALCYSSCRSPLQSRVTSGCSSAAIACSRGHATATRVARHLADLWLEKRECWVSLFPYRSSAVGQKAAFSHAL